MIFGLWSGLAGRLAGVLPGEQALLHGLHVRQSEEPARRAAGHVLQAAVLQPSVFEGVVGDLAAEEPVDFGQAEDSGIGEEAGHRWDG